MEDFSKQIKWSFNMSKERQINYTRKNKADHPQNELMF